MCGKLYGINQNEIDKREKEIFKLLNLEKIKNVKIGNLSTGQTQRVGIARCLVHNPKYYILDEATSGLDIISSQIILDFIKKEKENEKTIIYSTHYMEEAENICDKVLIINKGKIIKTGTPNEIKEIKLLTFPIKKKTIIGGKFIATVFCTILSSILGFISMYSMLYYLSGKLESFNKIELLSINKIILIIILFVEFSMLISALAIAISSKAKSFKEAQNKAQPLAFITMIPMFISMMGIKIDFKLSLIPFINVNLLMSEIIANTLNINYYITSLLSNIVFTLIILKLIDKLYKSDKILF